MRNLTDEGYKFEFVTLNGLKLSRPNLLYVQLFNYIFGEEPQNAEIACKALGTFKTKDRPLFLHRPTPISHSEQATSVRSSPAGKHKDPLDRRARLRPDQRPKCPLQSVRVAPEKEGQFGCHRSGQHTRPAREVHG